MPRGLAQKDEDMLLEVGFATSEKWAAVRKTGTSRAQVAKLLFLSYIKMANVYSVRAYVNKQGLWSDSDSFLEVSLGLFRKPVGLSQVFLDSCSIGLKWGLRKFVVVQGSSSSIIASPLCLKILKIACVFVWGIM